MYFVRKMTPELSGGQDLEGVLFSEKQTATWVVMRGEFYDVYCVLCINPLFLECCPWLLERVLREVLWGDF